MTIYTTDLRQGLIIFELIPVGEICDWYINFDGCFWKSVNMFVCMCVSGCVSKLHSASLTCLFHAKCIWSLGYQDCIKRAWNVIWGFIHILKQVLKQNNHILTTIPMIKPLIFWSEKNRSATWVMPAPPLKPQPLPFFALLCAMSSIWVVLNWWCRFYIQVL